MPETETPQKPPKELHLPLIRSAEDRIYTRVVAALPAHLKPRDEFLRDLIRHVIRIMDDDGHAPVPSGAVQWQARPVESDDPDEK